MCEPPEVLRAFAVAPVACLRSLDCIVVFEREEDVVQANPDLAALARLDLRGVAVTARSEVHDFVVRFFAPKYGIDEDPVTGSAFTQLIPYWAQVLGKQRLTARQVSRRGGEVQCELAGERVVIGGKAVMYLAGSIRV